MIRASRVRMLGSDGTVYAVRGERGHEDSKPFKGPARDRAELGVRQARMTEADPMVPMVTITVEPRAAAPDEPTQRSIQVAAVLADRAARGLVALPPGGAFVWGWCEPWSTVRLVPPAGEAGRAELLALARAGDLADTLVVLGSASTSDVSLETEFVEALKAAAPTADVRRVDTLFQLGGCLDGLRKVRHCEVLFPALGGRSTLEAVRVTVRPALHPTAPEIQVVGGDDGEQIRADARAVVRAVRSCERGLGPAWDTLVALPSVSLVGHSYDLALALADRIARGREFPGTRRVIATGAVETSSPGRIGSVRSVADGRDGGAPGRSADPAGKLALLRDAGQPGDSFIVPADWRPAMSVRDLYRAGGPDAPQWVFMEYVVPATLRIGASA